MSDDRDLVKESEENIRLYIQVISETIKVMHTRNHLSIFDMLVTLEFLKQTLLDSYIKAVPEVYRNELERDIVKAAMLFYNSTEKE